MFVRHLFFVARKRNFYADAFASTMDQRESVSRNRRTR